MLAGKRNNSLTCRTVSTNTNLDRIRHRGCAFTLYQLREISCGSLEGVSNFLGIRPYNWASGSGSTEQREMNFVGKIAFGC